MAAIKASTVRALAFRNAAFILENSRSIGLRSGLYAGRYTNRHPAAWIATSTPATLWQGKLSITTTIPGRNAGTSTADAGSYSVRVSNSAGSVTSDVATLAVAAAPQPPAPVVTWSFATTSPAPATR